MLDKAFAQIPNGDCLGHAVIRNFSDPLNSDFLYLQSFESRSHFRAELFDYRDYCGSQRIKAKLKDLPLWQALLSPSLTIKVHL